MSEKNKEIEQLEKERRDLKQDLKNANSEIRDHKSNLARADSKIWNYYIVNRKLRRQNAILTVITIIMAAIIIVLASKLAALF